MSTAAIQDSHHDRWPFDFSLFSFFIIYFPFLFLFLFSPFSLLIYEQNPLFDSLVELLVWFSLGCKNLLVLAWIWGVEVRYGCFVAAVVWVFRFVLYLFWIFDKFEKLVKATWLLYLQLIFYLWEETLWVCEWEFVAFGCQENTKYYWSEFRWVWL